MGLEGAAGSGWRPISTAGRSSPERPTSSISSAGARWRPWRPASHPWAPFPSLAGAAATQVEFQNPYEASGDAFVGRPRSSVRKGRQSNCGSSTLNATRPPSKANRPDDRVRHSCGLPGGAEGIRTSDLRSAGTRALHSAAASGSAGLAVEGAPLDPALDRRCFKSPVEVRASVHRRSSPRPSSFQIQVKS